MKQGLLFLFNTSMVCTTRHLAVVPFTPMRSFPPAFGTSHWHAPWEWTSAWGLSTLRWDACPGRTRLTRSSGGRDDADLTPSYRKSPPKSITWEHVCFRSFSLPATASFSLLLYSLFVGLVFPPPHELFPALPWFFLKPVLLHHCRRQTWCVWPERDVCGKAGAQDLLVEAGRGLLAALPTPSDRRSSGQIPAASPSQTADDKIGQKKKTKKPPTRTVLMCHTPMDEYFIVIPGKAFKGPHETTIMWSCLGTQIKNISNLTFKGEGINENIVSQNREIAWTKTAKRCTQVTY